MVHENFNLSSLISLVQRMRQSMAFFRLFRQTAVTLDNTQSRLSESLGETPGHPVPNLLLSPACRCEDPAELLHEGESWLSRSSLTEGLTSVALNQAMYRTVVSQQCLFHIHSEEIGRRLNLPKVLAIEPAIAHLCRPLAQWAGGWFGHLLPWISQKSGGALRGGYPGTRVHRKLPASL